MASNPLEYIRPDCFLCEQSISIKDDLAPLLSHYHSFGMAEHALTTLTRLHMHPSRVSHTLRLIDFQDMRAAYLLERYLNDRSPEVALNAATQVTRKPIDNSIICRYNLYRESISAEIRSIDDSLAAKRSLRRERLTAT